MIVEFRKGNCQKYQPLQRGHSSIRSHFCGFRRSELGLNSPNFVIFPKSFWNNAPLLSDCGQ